MGFYSDMSIYYDLLFPVSEEQERFFAELVRDFRPTRILDTACGSGNQMLCFAKRGIACCGFDLDSQMVALAREKLSDYENSSVKEGSFSMVKDIFDPGFDLILNIGNSLVHVPMREVTSFIRNSYEILNKNGILLVQILNYDRLLEKKIGELPLIRLEEEGLSFRRKYAFSENSRTLFTTEIEIPSKDVNISNTIPLYPLKRDQLLSTLKEEGFTIMGTFPGYVGKKFDPLSDALVVMAKK
jgi:SAM-dependent methyltransferase